MYKCLRTNKLDFTTQFHPRHRLKDTCIYSMYVLNKPYSNAHISIFLSPVIIFQWYTHIPLTPSFAHPSISRAEKWSNIIFITTPESKAKEDKSSNIFISRTTFSLVILYQQLSNRNKELNHLKTSSRNKIYLPQARVSLS